MEQALMETPILRLRSGQAWRASSAALAPRDIYFVGDLPKTRNAKTLRRLIRAALIGNEVGDTSALENPGSIEEIQRVAVK
jgi:acetyl-CoA synthetase